MNNSLKKKEIKKERKRNLMFYLIICVCVENLVSPIQNV